MKRVGRRNSGEEIALYLDFGGYEQGQLKRDCATIYVSVLISPAKLAASQAER
jgi:hypothetical protein